MGSNSTEDWLLPGMGPEPLSYPQPTRGEGTGAGMNLDMTGAEGNKDDGLIPPMPSQALRSIPADITLKPSERSLFDDASVLAVLREDCKWAVFDKDPPAAPQTFHGSSATTISPTGSSTSTIVPSVPPSLNIAHDLDPFTSPAKESFFPSRLPLKVLPPLCATAISIFWRYSVKQLELLAETQPLTVLMIFVFQPSRAPHKFMLFQSAYNRKYRDSKEKAGKAREEWNKLSPGLQNDWGLRHELVKQRRAQCYPGISYQAAVDRVKVVLRNARDKVMKQIEGGPHDELPQALIDDMTLVAEEAENKLRVSDTTRDAAKRRKGANSAQSKGNGGGGAQEAGITAQAKAIKRKATTGARKGARVAAGKEDGSSEGARETQKPSDIEERTKKPNSPPKPRKSGKAKSTSATDEPVSPVIQCPTTEAATPVVGLQQGVYVEAMLSQEIDVNAGGQNKRKFEVNEEPGGSQKKAKTVVTTTTLVEGSGHLRKIARSKASSTPQPSTLGATSTSGATEPFVATGQASASFPMGNDEPLPLDNQLFLTTNDHSFPAAAHNLASSVDAHTDGFVRAPLEQSVPELNFGFEYGLTPVEWPQSQEFSASESTFGSSVAETEGFTNDQPAPQALRDTSDRHGPTPADLLERFGLATREPPFLTSALEPERSSNGWSAQQLPSDPNITPGSSALELGQGASCDDWEQQQRFEMYWNSLSQSTMSDCSMFDSVTDLPQWNDQLEVPTVSQNYGGFVDAHANGWGWNAPGRLT